MDGERLAGLSKASPRLRRFVEEKALNEQGQTGDAWRERSATQQAAIQYSPGRSEKAQLPGKPRMLRILELDSGTESDGDEEVEASDLSDSELLELVELSANRISFNDEEMSTVENRSAEERQARLNVFVQLNASECKRLQSANSNSSSQRVVIDLGHEVGEVELSLNGSLGTSTLLGGQIESLLASPYVEAVDLGQAIRRPLVLKSSANVGLHSDPAIRKIGLQELHGGGKNVLIGIIDVGGFDFSHEDFLDESGETRFVSIWDQKGAGKHGPPTIRDKVAYGSELKRAYMNKAIQLSKQVGLAAYHIEPQSSLVVGSHGTHVASIAAGKSGLCPNADIAAVLIHLPEQDREKTRTFTDSTRIADALAYLLQIQQDNPERYDAVSINISLGTNGHAHDGTSMASRWIDFEFSSASQGRCISIAAGNAGQERSESADDMGHIMGRIHTSGKLESAGLTKDIRIQVAGGPIKDISENEIEIWYAGQDRIGVSVRPPDAGKWTRVVVPGSQKYSQLARSSKNEKLSTRIGVASEVFRPENGSNRISIFLSPAELPNGESSFVEPGVWTVRLHALEIRDGRYDGWIERDDPVPILGPNNETLYQYPSFFVGDSNVDRSSISTLACTRNAISVANVDDLAEKVAISSSQGPTRDGQQKPELAAPGTRIVAACGFHPKNKTISMTGTSMSSPFVAGVAGLMLAIEPTLSPAQIRAIMIRTATPLPGVNYQWQHDAGFGVINPQACLLQVIEIQNSVQALEEVQS